MTTTAITLPAGGFRIAWRAAVMLLIAGLAAATAILIIATFSGNAEVGRYEASLAPLIERHNGSVAEWNAFVSRYNATATFSLGAYDAQAAEASAELNAIAAGMQSTIIDWAAIVPPASRAEPHAAVLEAMRLTLEGVTGVAAYFEGAVSGEGDYARAQASLATIDRASAYWAQAKSFEG